MIKFGKKLLDKTEKYMHSLSIKGPVLKSFMTQVAIIEDHDVPRKFWIL